MQIKKCKICGCKVKIIKLDNKTELMAEIEDLPDDTTNWKDYTPHICTITHTKKRKKDDADSE